MTTPATSFSPESPRRVLLIKPSALGDVATALPLLCDLKRAWPGAQIDWLVEPAFAALLHGHDALHEIIPFERRKLASWWWKPSAWRLFRALLRRLRQARYDVVVDAQGLLRSGILARITGAPVRVGFASAREGATLFYTHKARLPDRGRQLVAVDRMRALLAPLGLATAHDPEFRLPVTVAPPVSWADYVAVIPGARWDTKRWPTERFAQVVRRLLAGGDRVLLLGSKSETALCEQIQSAAGGTPDTLRTLAGQTSLAEMVALLARASLVVGNDSGPLHVAVALGRPVVGLYGPTPPAHVGPSGQLEHVLRHEVPCHPCRRRECDHHSCMQGLGVEVVWEKVRTRRGTRET